MLEESIPVEGVLFAEVFVELGSYTVDGSNGKVEGGGSAVTEREGSYTGERGLARRWGLDAGESLFVVGFLGGEDWCAEDPWREVKEGEPLMLSRLEKLP